MCADYILLMATSDDPRLAAAQALYDEARAAKLAERDLAWAQHEQAQAEAMRARDRAGVAEAEILAMDGGAKLLGLKVGSEPHTIHEQPLGHAAGHIEQFIKEATQPPDESPTQFKDVALIPSQAVYTLGGTPYVLLVERSEKGDPDIGRTRQVPVRVLVNDGKLARVLLVVHQGNPLKGEAEELRELRPEEEVVLSRQIEIGDGQPLHVTAETW